MQLDTHEESNGNTLRVCANATCCSETIGNTDEGMRVCDLVLTRRLMGIPRGYARMRLVAHEETNGNTTRVCANATFAHNETFN